MPRSARLAAALALLFAGAVATAPAGVPLVDSKGVEFLWDLDTEQANVVGGRVTFYVDPRGTVDSVSGTKSVAQAVRDGVRAWEIATTRVRFQEDTTRPATGRSGTDRVNWIGWESGTLGPLTFARTYATSVGRHVVDADIALNEGFTWDTRTPGLADVADIESLVAHEWGHVLGAGHVPLRSATMYFSSEAGTTSLRSLSPDDAATVGRAYPNAAFGTTTGVLSGRVEIDAVADDRSALVVAVPVTSGEPAIGTLTRPDGTYDLAGVPAGTWRVLVVPANPLGDAVSPYWSRGNSAFLPGFASLTPGNPGPILVLRSDAATTTSVPLVRVSPRATTHEPDDSRADATPLALGEAAAGRIEEPGDEDWYSFDLVQGQSVSISVLAWGLGADCDPAFTLYGPAQQFLTIVNDVRSGAGSHFFPEGDDFDARLLAYTAPAAGNYALRIRNETAGVGTRAFYVVSVTQTSDAPSGSLTSVAALPARIDAGGASTATIVVRPVREDGTDVGPGATVEVVHDGAGVVGPVTYSGNGEYRATVTSPATPGRDAFAATVTTSAGTASVPDGATLVYLGPPDAKASTMLATPRRIAADGAETTTLRYLPRDAANEILGAGRAVGFSQQPDLGLVVGQVKDLGDGAYETTVTAGTVDGSTDVAAFLSGNATGSAARVSLGFGLAEVLAQAVLDVQAFRAATGVPKLSRRALAAAAGRLANAVSAATLGAEGERRAVAKAKAGLASVQTALSKSRGRLADPGTLRELARALRGVSASAIGRAVVVSSRDQRKLDTANSLFAAGDSFYAAGSFAKAGAKWARAYAVVAPLLP